MLKVGILTSGGDAPGINSYIAFLRAMLWEQYHGEMEIVGFRFGYEGLCNNLFVPITNDVTTGIKRLSGSVLGCNKGFFFGSDKGKAALATIKKHQLNYLIVVGGDGTRRGLEETLFPAIAAANDSFLSSLKIIHASKSIDNNNASMRSFGFYTAAEEVMATFDKLNATAKTHRRFFVVEVMGDNSIELLLSAFEGGADIFVANLAPVKLSYEELTLKTATAINALVAEGKSYGSVALMEKTLEKSQSGDQFALEVQKLLKRPETSIRFVDPGHLLRGSTPVQRDRELASRFALATVKAIAHGRSGTIVYNSGKTQLIPFDDRERMERVGELRIASVVQKLAVLRMAGAILIGLPDEENIV